MTGLNVSASKLVAQAASHDKPTQEEPPLPEIDTEIDLSEHKLQYDVDILRQQLNESIDTHKLRIGYANKIFVLVCLWLLCVVVGVLLSGFNEKTGFILSDQVLIAFIATTTLNVLGLFAIVAKWMFQQNNNQTIVKK